MSVQNVMARIHRSAPAWGLSIALHVGLLAVLGAITWRVVHRSAPETVVTLAPQPDAGSARKDAPEDLTDPGRQVGSREAGTRQDLPTGIPPAPEMGELEESLLKMSLPEIPEALLKAPADPAREMLAALGTSRAVDPKTRRTGLSLPSGLSPGFGDRIGVLRGRGLDVVLVLDATGSMRPYIDQAKRRLREILDLVTGLVPDTQFGMVAYKDYCDTYGPNATRSLRITKDLEKVRVFLDKIRVDFSSRKFAVDFKYILIIELKFG